MVAKPLDDDESVLNYITDLANNNPGKIVLLRGNHEAMAINAIRNGSTDTKDRWFFNGLYFFSVFT
jgi:hypothetical protein